VTIIIHKHNAQIHGKASFLRADDRWCRKDISTPYGAQKLHYFDYNKSKHEVAQLVEALCYKQKNAGSIPDGVIPIFIDIILPAALWLSSPLRVHQEYFLRGKGGR
jgi:hypothetical protein